MMQQISEQVESMEERLNRRNGLTEKRKGECEIHGAFEDRHYSGEGNITTAGWAGCPTCKKLQWDEEARQQILKENAEREARRIDSMVDNSGIPSRFRKKSFDNFKAVNQKAASHLKKVREYGDVVAGDDHGGRCLLMLGKVGNGKTHLACALLEKVIRDTRQPAYYWTFSELVRYVKASFSKGAEHSEDDAYKDFAKGRLAVLDEVGMQNFTEFEQAVAYEAINARYLAERPTVLITNLQAKDLPLCVGERVVDRLREGGGKALDFDWKSYRVGGGS
ncbi:ATP-binding protein [uncultured Marinobacter sp.]|uniref:ATP-binding protein n=1 Tax=uncultured Marinobacter sp. TaxID=187379 RepID=UPI0030DCC3B0